MTNKDFAKDLNELIKQFTIGINKNINSAIEKVSDELIHQLSMNSPRKTGEYAASWTKNVYNKKAYIGNKKQVIGMNKKSIPLINILEYSQKHGKPHVEKIFRSNLTNLENIFKNNLEK